MRHYDSTGKVSSFVYKKGEGAETSYFFARNVQGDIIAVYRNSDSALIGTYEYDLWGRPVSIKEAQTGIDTDGILTKNPFRYRGYYYDNETGFYYSAKRYYDVEIRRWISPEPNVYTGGFDTGAGLNGYNVFAYCANNPINLYDPTGEFVISTLVICVVAGAAIGATIGGIIGNAYANSRGYTGWDKAKCILTGVGIGGVVGGAVGYVAASAVASATGVYGVSVTTTTTAINVSTLSRLAETNIKHALKRHMPLRIANNFKHMSETSINNYLRDITFLNKSWTEQQITEALNYGYRQAIFEGFRTGEYTFQYLGDKVTIYLENSIFHSGYGDYVYLFEEIMHLLGE